MNIVSGVFNITMDGKKRLNIKQGLKVKIGGVKDILTKSPSHPHGIKVRLTSGDVGRVKEIADDTIR
jgi:uncharacterized repeat protein (TIGR03833 family)